MKKATQGQIDAANEWTAEHYPDLDGAEYDAKLAEALTDIVAIDDAQDAVAEKQRTSMTATSVVAELVSKVAARFEIEGVPMVKDEFSARAAAIVLGRAVPLRTAVVCAEAAARCISMGDHWHSEALHQAERAEAALAEK